MWMTATIRVELDPESVRQRVAGSLAANQQGRTWEHSEDQRRFRSRSQLRRDILVVETLEESPNSTTLLIASASHPLFDLGQNRRSIDAFLGHIRRGDVHVETLATTSRHWGWPPNVRADKRVTFAPTAIGSFRTVRWRLVVRIVALVVILVAVLFVMHLIFGDAPPYD
jgi:hypothetical protein